ncbi:MAG: hypothetical protein R2863_11930 [Candidatus Kapaibacterium sp.]
MKRIFLLIAVALLTLSTTSALDPIKVAIVNTGTAPVSVEIRLNNYTGGTATLLYTQPATNYTPNGSGIIIANISGAGWTAIASNTVTNYHILDVYVGGSLVAQYRLDNLLLSQSQGGVLDIEGNLTPAESGAGSVGSDGNRWGDVYVEESTMHIGPVDGELNNTELALSYNTTTNTAHIQVDATDAILATSSGVTIPGTLTATGVTKLGNLTGAGTRNIAVNASGEVVVAESSVNTDATINGNGTTGSPLGINLANANTWTGVQTFNGSSTLMGGNFVLTGSNKISNNAFTAVTIDDDLNIEGNLVFNSGFDAVIGNLTGNIRIQDDLNITGSLDVDTDLNVDGNTTHVGTLDQQGAISNSTGEININDNLIVTGYSDLQGPIGSTAGNLHIGDYAFINGDGTTNLTLTDGGIQRNSGSNETITLQNTGAGNLTLAVTGDVTASGDVTLSNLAGGGTQNLQVDNSGKLVVGGGGGTVSTNATINGDGSGGSPLGINLANSNTWTANQTFSSSFLITANARIAMTNSDNNARDIRFQEPSGTGSQYIGWRAPSVSKNSNYVFPTAIGTPGQVLAINTVGAFGDSATTHWITPSGGGTVSTNATINGDGSGGSPLGINLANSNTWTGLQIFANAFSIFQNARIALTNNDNNARDIRWQEPSGTGSQYIGWRAPSVSKNSNYVFPTAIGTPGQVLSIASTNGIDSATTQWINPTSFTYIEHNYSGGNTAKTDIANDAQIIYLINAGVGPVNETLGSLSNGSRVTVYNNSGQDFTFTDAVSGTLNVGNTKTWYRIGGTWRLSN